MEKRLVKVWDIPTRLFHWLLVALVAAAFLTGFDVGGSFGEIHKTIGLAVVGLLAFRIVWGFVGSTYARFTQFVPGPGRVFAYLRGQWHELGHNPLGAFSVLALLTLTLIQVVSGLFASGENGSFTPPLNALVSSATSDAFTGFHARFGWWLVAAIVCLHVASIVFYAVVKKHFLLPAMFTGRAETDDADAQDARGGGWLAFVVAVVIAVAVVWVADGGLNPPPPPMPEQTAPAW
ncbi:MAG: cytochrome b/b6 domain-containing protein [Azoarcus sp.]|jgi:cytochrome b|nr:cytochrome b/b6 domain-containing protein [Azoarcus sp.]